MKRHVRGVTTKCFPGVSVVVVLVCHFPSLLCTCFCNLPSNDRATIPVSPLRSVIFSLSQRRLWVLLMAAILMKITRKVRKRKTHGPRIDFMWLAGSTTIRWASSVQFPFVSRERRSLTEFCLFSTCLLACVWCVGPAGC